MELVHLVMAETTFWTILLMIHGLFSMALIGALTHQAASVLRAPKAGGAGLAARFSAVKGDVYASAVVGLWVVTFIFGAWIYVKYRTYIRIPIEQEEFWKTLGAFELKEQGFVQLSFNLEDPERTGLGQLIAAVRARHKVESGELIGLAPKRYIDEIPDDLAMPDFDPDRKSVEGSLRFHGITT
jgi:hypothetical protein